MMLWNKKEQKYPADLSRPEVSFDEEMNGLLVKDKESIRALILARFRRVEAKSEVLMKFFDVPTNWSNEDRWHALAMHLAAQHIRGFQEAKKSGAKKKWTDRLRADLRIAADDLVEANKKNPGKGASWACKELAKKAPWNALVAGGNPAEALRKQYGLANQHLVEMLLLERSPNQLRALMNFGKKK